MSAPGKWAQKIQTILIEANALPVAGTPPLFPWDAMAKEAANIFQVDACPIAPRKIEQLSANQLTSGFGTGAVIITLMATPLQGQFFWVMGKEEAAKLAALALLPSHSNKGFSSPKFQEGFYYFLVNRALAAANQLPLAGNLFVKMGTPSALPDEQALCIDIEIRHPKHALWGRLICPVSYMENFKSHFQSLPPPPLTEAVAQEIDTTLKLQIGQTELPRNKWNEVHTGDFVLLDRCTYDPKTRKGSLLLVLENTPLFRARIKDDSLKILGFAAVSAEDVPLESAEDEDAFEEPEELIEEQTGKEDSLMLTIEAGRIQFKLDKLLKLAPEEMLEFPVHPESGVGIFAENKKIATGELIRLGDLIGVKILQRG